MEPFYITTPIYYVNARPHLGHAYTTIVADCITRFQGLLGRKTFFLTGTDEHGDKIVQAAEKSGMDPQSYADAISSEFKALWPRLGIQNDRFIRTTDARHKQCVQQVLQRVYDKGDIYFDEYGGHYCYGCERFYAERELEDGLCPQHREKPEFIKEKNYFFRMAKYQGRLLEHIAKHPDFIRPERYRNEVVSLLESGALEDLCISRPKSRLTWGIELPFDSDFVCYVWFDALLNYIAGLDWPDGDGFRTFWPAAQHLVAKDILKPHAVFWPTMLMAADIPLYAHLNVHGYWLVRETKMSKSLGNAIDPLALAGQYGLSAFRYFLLREMHFGNDAAFSEEALVARLNSDLANDLGNLFNRVLSMVHKYLGGATPTPGSYAPEDEEIRSLALDACRNFQDLYGRFRFSQALEALWELIRALNRYVDTSAPWTLFKAGDGARLGTVMYVLLESLRKTALHLWSTMPEAAGAMLEQLGLEREPARGVLQSEGEAWGLLPPGTAVARSSTLFPRIELPAEGEQELSSGTDSSPAAKSSTVADISAKSPQNQPERIEYADFQKLDLRVGTVLQARKHPEADKLLVLTVDIGEETPRQIVAGIAAHWGPEALSGRQVVVVANLKPRKLRGVESQGMLLASPQEGGMPLVAVTHPVANGSKVS